MSVSKPRPPVDIRQVVSDRLQKLGQSTYWLQKQLEAAGVHVSVYRFLAGERDVSAKIAGQMLGTLGLKVAAGRAPVRKPKPPG